MSDTPGWKQELKEAVLDIAWFLGVVSMLVLVVGLLWAWGGTW